MINPESLLPPETLVDYGPTRGCAAVMFHYIMPLCPTIAAAAEIADGHGFDVSGSEMEAPATEEACLALDEYTLGNWTPTPPNGEWVLGAKFYGDDGWPIALFLRKRTHAKSLKPTVSGFGTA